ncbi:hypothetical protein WN55_05884 [Dufourea novaeangliae]|uniref:Uncharacterized protein n=1 Tax=Dufourea novaeangliae TaxID=178035 RepID=A0A154PN99_DUFNO|nr:hypothetical protein WN55_05884 [Dufourea novaeangliae]
MEYKQLKSEEVDNEELLDERQNDTGTPDTVEESSLMLQMLMDVMVEMSEGENKWIEERKVLYEQMTKLENKWREEKSNSEKVQKKTEKIEKGINDNFAG